MPELPEVETVKNKLSPKLIGKKILSVSVYYEKYNCLNDIHDEVINRIDRKGKFLIFTLDNFVLVSHLRMEGKYFIKDKQSEKEKHDLAIFNFDDFNLVYNDTRKFGVFYLFKRNEDYENLEPLSNVGPEPFDAKKEYLYEKIKNKNEHIKTLLLDQSIISGLGNIYVDEVLFMSNVNPFRIGKTITLDECESIIENSIIVLNKAIKLGGSTIKSFASLNGEIGHFQTQLLVHNKENERCPVCSNIIIKSRCGGRGTYYCPTCERLDKNSKFIAITGPIASGKSVVLNMIGDLGYETYSCDHVYKELLENSKPMQREIKKALGTIDLDKIKKIVFDDEEKNTLLKEATHKYVMKEIFENIKSNVVFVEVPLLFEGHFEKAFDKVISIYPSDEIEKKLYESRGFTKEEYEKRLSSQFTKEVKKMKSDYIIYNTSTLSELREKVLYTLKELEV